MENQPTRTLRPLEPELSWPGGVGAEAVGGVRALPVGTTAYDAAGTARDEGRWWVTEDEYCSWWSSTGETCYQVLRDGEMLIWRTKGLFARTFDASVVPGDQLEAK